MMSDMTTPSDAPRWLLDEVANAGRENLDPEHVARYDAKENADGEAEVRLLQRHGLDPTSLVIDLGAGTGQFTLAAAPVTAQVVAVDVSSVMLNRLRFKLAASGLANVDVQQAGFLTYQHAGRPADVVYSRFALHHLPDFWKAVALQRVRSMLRTGGVLRLSDVVFSFDLAEASGRIDAWCESVDGRGDDQWHREDVIEHVRAEHSTFTWLLEPMLMRAGFTVEERTTSADGILATYLARADATPGRD